MSVKRLFGGAGTPVMGHSGEGELLSGHAVPRVFGSDGPAVRSKDNRCGVRQFAGQARHSGSCQPATRWG
jgi:hypothetical protein